MRQPVVSPSDTGEDRKGLQGGITLLPNNSSWTARVSCVLSLDLPHSSPDSACSQARKAQAADVSTRTRDDLTKDLK